MKSRITLASFLAVAAAIGCLGLSQARAAFDVFWLPAGSGNWNTGANWADLEGGAPRGDIPSAFFEEIAVINNGGTATLSAAAGDTTGGIVLGRTATDSGTLTISSGGSLVSEASASSNGSVLVGQSGLGTLNVSGTGSLTAPSLGVGGLAGSQANFSGSANVTVTGTTTIGRGLKLTGPNVTFSSATGVTFQSTSVLTAEITSPGGHSAVKTAGTLSLGGTLNVQFNGVTPTLGSAWDLADATAIAGNFSNASVGGSVAVAGAPAAALGSAYRLRTVDGGMNGKLLQVALEGMLVLRVNRDTGEMTIRNPLGTSVPALAGYEIASPHGSLLTSYKGISGAPAGDSGWTKAVMNSSTGLAEFKPSGSLNVSSSGTNLSLGAGFSKTAVAGQPLGVTGEDLTFSYHTLGGEAVTGQIEYVGTPFLNNIALIVNTTTGQATLKNDTLQSIAIDGYSIVSSTGALSGASWTGLGASFANWEKSPADPGALSETNRVAPTALAAGQSASLGVIGNFSTQAAQEGLAMKFIIGDEFDFRFASVSFTSGAGIAGDFNGSGKVDGADFLAWQRNTSVGSLADWKANYGAGSAVAAVAGAASAVPEPKSILLATLAAATCAGRRRRRHPRSITLQESSAMIRTTAIALVAAASLAAIRVDAAVTLSFDPSQPTLGTYDQSQLLDDAEIPGGTTPGGGTYNSQAFTDNVGPLGQTFTTPGDKHLYALTGVSVKGVGDAGGGALDADATWALRISKVNGTTLAPLKTFTGVAVPQGAAGTEWFTFSISGFDVPALAANTQYAFEIYSTAGWFGVDATQGDAAYAGGTAFNSLGPGRSFTDNTLGNLANHGYDRTFIAQLAAPPGGPGDADNNGSVGVSDYNLIKANLEKSVSMFTNGDLDGNSFVDLNDFRRWRLAASPAVLAAAGIPEPSAVLLAGTTFLGFVALRRRVRRLPTALVALTMLAIAASSATATVTMTMGTTAPTPGLYDQFDFIDDASIPGGTTPGGGTYNSQAFSDNNGPPGQIFTTPASASPSLPSFTLDAVWLKGANTGGNVGGITAATTWAIRISEVNGTDLTPVKTVTGIPSLVGMLGTEWFTWTFAGSDLQLLQPNKQYAFDLYSSTGWLGFDADTSDSYAGGTAFNSGDGAARSFAGLTTGDLASHGYDRTFLVALTPALSIVAGDVDGDGDVDLDDFNLIKTNYFLASGATRSLGDLNGDGKINLADYAIWRNNAPPAVLAQVGIPEPASLALAVACAGGLLASRRRLRLRGVRPA